MATQNFGAKMAAIRKGKKTTAPAVPMAAGKKSGFKVAKKVVKKGK